MDFEAFEWLAIKRVSSYWRYFFKKSQPTPPSPTRKCHFGCFFPRCYETKKINDILRFHVSFCLNSFDCMRFFCVVFDVAHDVFYCHTFRAKRNIFTIEIVRERNTQFEWDENRKWKCEPHFKEIVNKVFHFGFQFSLIAFSRIIIPRSDYKRFNLQLELINFFRMHFCNSESVQWFFF